MKQRIRAITQVSLAVLLALTLGLVTAVPPIAQGAALGSASISPSTEVYDLGDPADVKTTVTWHEANNITAVKHDGHELGGNNYSVIEVDDNRAILTINASYLAGKPVDIGDNLVLAIEFDSGDSAVFTIEVVRYPAVSPDGALYDLDNPPDFIQTSIAWGRAGSISGITAGEDYLTEGLGKDYIVLRNKLLILSDYLASNLSNLKEEGDKLELEIKFGDVDDPASFTIVAFETIPTPNPYAYDLFHPAPVEITIKWHTVKEVVSIEDDDKYSLETGDYALSETTLTIFESYLERKLTREEPTLVLTIKFNVGAIDFAIKAVDGTPSITPERADYDLDNPANATTTITWGTATNVTSIVDDDDYTLMKDTDYTLDDTIGGKATLTILNDYLSDELTDVDQSVDLSVRFGFNSTIHPGLQHYATFNITAIGTYPSISPVVAPHDLRSKAAVNTTITWRDAKNVTSIVDDGNNTLIRKTDYTLGDTIGGKATLTILSDPYLAGNLTAKGQSVVLTIEFDVGDPVTFTITAVDDDPSIDPQGADYDLDPDPDKPGDIKTKITWQSPIQVVSVSENGHELHRGTDYIVGDTVGDEATLTILEDYLATKLTDIRDEAVLTIEFSVGSPVKFTITGVRYPSVLPTEVLYDLDARDDFIETSITWGSAIELVSITENDNPLTSGLNNDYNDCDYIVLGDTLVITDNYLRGLDIWEVAVLNIAFDDDYTADFAITVKGTPARILDTRVVYDLDDPADVQTTITWGSAIEVVSITENDNRLIPEHDYVVEEIVEGEATLTISRAYLEEKLERWVDEILLTIEFDTGDNVQLSVAGLARCFIATAAYGTAIAPEIQVLREFRDGYLLTNSLGQALVHLYYRISPPIAQFITEHPGLKPIVSIGLVPAVAISTAAVNTSPAEKAAIAGLLVLVSVAMGVWAARRRSRRPICT